VHWIVLGLPPADGSLPPVPVTARQVANNDETFNSFDAKQWSAAVKQLDEVMTDWEKAVEAADENKLKDWYSDIAHIGAHNAYHIGQIIYVRKEQGSWNPEKGVK